MNVNLLLLILGLPLFIYGISSLVKYPSDVSGEDKKRALDDFISDCGLDFYFIGLSVTISTTIARYGVSFPQTDMILIVLYSLLSAVIARLYTMPWAHKRVNLCFLFGFLFALAPISYAIYVCLWLL